LMVAQHAGLACVADQCTKVEHRTLSLQGWCR
jgi:predicted CoA-binding protein